MWLNIFNILSVLCEIVCLVCVSLFLTDILMETFKKATTVPVQAANLLTIIRVVANLFKHSHFSQWLQLHFSEVCIFSATAISSNLMYFEHYIMHRTELKSFFFWDSLLIDFSLKTLGFADSWCIIKLPTTIQQEYTFIVLHISLKVSHLFLIVTWYMFFAI